MGIPKRARTTALLSFLVIASLFLGWRLTQAQTAGAPLVIRNVQVLNTIGNTICQHVCENGVYKLAWQSADLGGRPSVRIGDIDNDGQKEIVASVYYYTRTVGSRRNAVDYYNYRVYVFKDGAVNGSPSWSSGELGELPGTIILDSWVADVDNDSQPGLADNELVLIRTNRLEVYHFNGSTGTYDTNLLRAYPTQLFSLDVGDADNFADNEIAVFCKGTPYIWKWTGAAWTEYTAEAVGSQFYGPGMTSLGLTYIKVRNADNIIGNEIIATGNNQRLMVWKWQDSAYKLTSVSQAFDSYEAYGIDSGDLNGDNLNEVVISLWGTKKLPPRLVALAYEGGAWVLKNTYNSNYIDQRDLRTGDLDGDNRIEVVLNDGGAPAVGLKILDFIGLNIVQGTFRQVYAAPGEAYPKLEVR